MVIQLFTTHKINAKLKSIIEKNPVLLIKFRNTLMLSNKKKDGKV